jgi:predicted GTPase
MISGIADVLRSIQELQQQLTALEDATSIDSSPDDPRNYRSEDLRAVIAERGLFYPLDVLLAGATGAGKSSTQNAIFGETVAKVGDGVDPETQGVTAYRVNDYLRIRDSAGLGDGAQADVRHARGITHTLLARCAAPHESDHLIDLVLVILDGSSRDLGTAYHLLESVVLKSIAPERVVVAINQADQAMKGRHWDHELNRPELVLAEFLAEKGTSVQRRIKEATGLHIQRPVCYSAAQNWNIGRLIGHIIEHVPHARRPVK